MKTISIQELMQELNNNNSNLKLINALAPSMFGIFIFPVIGGLVS